MLLSTTITAVMTMATPSSGGDACAGAPAGMTCVPAGDVTIGVGDFERKVALERFFIDDHVVTNEEFERCVKDKSCDAPLTKGKKGAPALVDWPRAERYCAFAGKRLAQESEWEAAAQKGAVAVRAADDADKKPSAALGEWTNTWHTTPKTCPSASAPIPFASKNDYFPPALCGARDVLDACDGAVLCGTLHERVWKDPAAPSARQKASSFENDAQKTFRCATANTYLTRFPSRWTTRARSKPPDPAAPTTDELAAFNGVEEDTLDVPPCEKAGRSFLTCRDPRSYLKTNEPRLNVIVPYIENQGGAYTGVASDQNYTLVALARSQWAWLFDYDWNVVRWHHVLRALILDAPDRKAFVESMKKPGLAHGVDALKSAYKDDPELANLIELYKASATSLTSYYARQLAEPFTWLGSDEHYDYVRLLYRQGRMRAMRGNMLDSHAMISIGDAAKKLHVPIRVYYPSNAPEFWPFSDQYRKNVRNLPFDDDSIVAQTISGVSLKTGFGQTGYWHYNIQYGHEQQRLLALPGYTREKQLLWHRVKSESTELTLCGLPP